MKIFGSITELVSAVFRKNSQAITVRPNQATTYTASRDIQLPPGDAAHVLVSADSTQTFTNKSYDADGTGNSLTNVDDGNIKSGAAINATKVADGSVDNTEFQRLGTAGTAGAGNLVTTDGTQTLTNKTLTSPTVNTPTITSPAISNPTVSGTLLLQNAAGSQPELHFSEDPDNGTDLVAIKAPASLGATYTLTLPPDDGDSGEVLSTNGSGVLDWTTAATVPAEGAVYSNGTALQTAGSFAGNANEVVGVNSGATAVEYKALATGTAGTDYAIVHGVGTVTFNLPDASATARGVVTTGTQTLAGAKTFSSQVTTTNASGFRIDSATIDTTIQNDATNTQIDSTGGLLFRTNGTTNALTLSTAQAATFEGLVTTNSASGFKVDSAVDATVQTDGTNAYLDSSGPLLLRTNGTTTALTLSAAQAATFVGQVTTTSASGFRVDGTTDAQLQTDATNTQLDSTGGIQLRTNGTTAAITIDTSQFVTLSAKALNANGDATLPSYAFTNDTDSGMYRAASNTLGFATNATRQLTVGDGSLRYMDTPAGSASAPSISAGNDTNTGIYHAADVFGLSANGNAGLEVRSAGVVFNASTAPAGAVDIFGDSTTPGANEIFTARQSNGTLHFYNGNTNGATTGESAAAAIFKVTKDTSTSRSINAAGTLNASGADYAEYMEKADPEETIEKGEICGVTSGGKLTKKWSESISFVVKSTDPSYVGGDSWSPRSEPQEGETWEQLAAVVESERVKWDRIAFCGQVPCIAAGSPGDWIVPSEGPSDSISSTAVSDSAVTFEQHRRSVGQVWKDLGSGRVLVAVGIK